MEASEKNYLTCDQGDWKQIFTKVVFRDPELPKSKED